MRISDFGFRISGLRFTTLSFISVLSLLTGCARDLVITQDSYINTAMHADRPADRRTGEPLELNIVSLYPNDLKHPANSRLAPEMGITSDVWFRDRPVLDDTQDTAARGTRFWVPRGQVVIVTNDSKAYGTLARSAARGGSHDNSELVLRRAVDSKGLFGGQPSVIYVFGKFTNAQGNVLPKPPARFHPLGDYGKELRVRIHGEDLESGGRK